MNINNTNRYSITDWNSELADVLIPNNVILCLYIFLGILGNLVVILVYHFRLKNKSEDRYFIPMLAVTDLIASTVCGSFGIALNMMQAEFYNTHLCKTWWFFAASSTFMSILILFIIATQRYLKVCRSFDKRMSMFHKRLAIALSLLISIGLSLPTTAMYGSVDFPNPDGSLIGRRCSKLKSMSKISSIIYGVVIIVMILIVIMAMIYFYVKIGCKLYNHFKYATTVHRNTKDSRVEDLHSTCSKSESNLENRKYICKSESTCAIISRVDSNAIIDAIQENQQKEIIYTPRMERKEQTKSKKTRREQQNKRIINKITIMFMLITIVFLICYIPKVILTVIEGLNPTFWERFSDNERAGILFIYRFYIFSNVINPYIYAFMDSQFRKEMKAFFRFK